MVRARAPILNIVSDTSHSRCLERSDCEDHEEIALRDSLRTSRALTFGNAAIAAGLTETDQIYARCEARLCLLRFCCFTFWL